MGYYTNYYLKLENASVQQALEVQDYITNNAELAYALGEMGEDNIFTSHEGTKWYERDVDMRLLSAKFPTVTFVLSGDGEESPDYWKRFYTNGECIKEQVGRIVYD